MPSTIDKCELFRIKHITFLEGAHLQIFLVEKKKHHKIYTDVQMFHIHKCMLLSPEFKTPPHYYCDIIV